MRLHFKAVKKQREEKYGTDTKNPREIEDPVTNGAADSWKKQFA
jgi:hypothetical protein